jgi:putative glutamine amidotransferase
LVTRPVETSPLIGITVGQQPLTETDGTRLRVRSTYPRAIAGVGGIPILIPLQVDVETLRRIYDRLEGVLVTGGGDVNPTFYGMSQSAHTIEVDSHRDEVEIQLVRWAVEDDKPLLGICRGHQVMNVALGGTLIQDINNEIPGSIRHDFPTDDWFTKLPHEVNVDPSSKLYQSLGLKTDRFQVNSMHHQSVKQLASPLCLTAQADDGVIEAVEIPDHHFAIGVQWHPEALFETHQPHRQLFQAFINSTRR